MADKIVAKFKNGIKEFKFIENIPYCYSNKLKKYIKFNSIHFNSGAKVLMKDYFRKLTLF